jgi:hypothetical protein
MNVPRVSRGHRLLLLGAVVLATSGGIGAAAGPILPAGGKGFVCTLRPGQTSLPAATRHGLIQHLRQYADVSLASSTQRAAARRLLVRLHRAARRWSSPAAARRAGYDTHTAPRRGHDELAHYLHAEWRRQRSGAATLDPARPKALIYANEPARPLVLVGVMYAARRGERGPTPGGPITRWHSHLVCVSGDRRGRKPLVGLACPPGARLEQGSEMLHVWFTRDLRSAFSVSAPEVELCRDGLLHGKTCLRPRVGQGM